MIPREEYKESVKQLIAKIDEMLRTIDGHILRIWQKLYTRQNTHFQDRALFHVLDLLLKERRELVKEKERALLVDDS